MTTLAALVDNLSQAAALFGVPADVHGVVPLMVTDENGGVSFQALQVTERSVQLGSYTGWNLAVAELDLMTGAITVPSLDHGIVRLLDTLGARIPKATSWLGVRTAKR